MGGKRRKRYVRKSKKKPKKSVLRRAGLMPNAPRGEKGKEREEKRKEEARDKKEEEFRDRWLPWRRWKKKDG